MIPKLRAWYDGWMWNVIGFKDDPYDYLTKTISLQSIKNIHEDMRQDKLVFWSDTHFDDLIIMKSLGLPDRNGVEIFEGDICRVITHNEEINPLYCIVVYRKQPNPGFYLDDQKRRDIYFGEVKTFEVIGNIHQNPELLETESESEVN